MARNYWTIQDKDEGKRVFLDRYQHACAHASGEVVDVCCGWGYGAYLLARDGQGVTKVTGMDWDEEALLYASMECRDGRVCYEAANVQTAEGLAQIPECDWVVTLETVEHLPDCDVFLRRCMEVARGGIVLSTPVLEKLHERKGNYHSFSPEQIDGWFAGWGTKEFSTRLGHAGARNPKLHDCYYLGVYRRHA